MTLFLRSFLQRLEALPEVLGDALKQWFELAGDSGK